MDDLADLLALDINHESDSTGVVLELRVIQALFRRWSGGYTSAVTHRYIFIALSVHREIVRLACTNPNSVIMTKPMILCKSLDQKKKNLGSRRHPGVCRLKSAQQLGRKFILPTHIGPAR